MKKQVSPGCSFAFSLAFGGIFALAGAFIIAISFDIIPVDPDNFKAPRLVVAAAGLVFFLAGIWVAFQAGLGSMGGDTPFAKWIQYILTLTIMVAFVSVFLWVGFAPGERQFQTSTSVGPVTTTETASEAEGRCIFGVFGVLAGLGVLYYAITQPMRILGRLPGKHAESGKTQDPPGN